MSGPTGPDTHYKVLQVVAEALRADLLKDHKIRVWGYRNVWHTFDLSEDDLLIIPVNKTKLDELHKRFVTCFSTQKNASFPAHQLDGPFSLLSVKIQKEQLNHLATLLGNKYIQDHPQLESASGLLFLKEMTKEQFLESAKHLEDQLEK